jgi:uncharacterized membrane protein
MQRSILLAKLIGPPFLAIALGLFLDQNTYWGMIDEVIRHPSPIGNMLIYLSGLLSLLGGLAIVNAHPSWTALFRQLPSIWRSTGRTIYRHQDLRHSETWRRFAI